MLTELPLSLTAFLCCCGLLACDRQVSLQLRKNWAELFCFTYDADDRDAQLIRDERRQVQAVVLQRCAPYMIVICLSSFVCCFVALMVMPECWRLVIELDYLAMSSNVIGAIFLYRHFLPGARNLKLRDWQLAGAFYLPWVCVTFLQITFFSCGDEARDGYYSTRLVYFCYRALLSVALMCPLQCTLAELICSGMVAADVQRSEARAAMMSIELLFLLLIFAGTCFLGQWMIDWAFANARKAEEALSALVDARLGLIEKLCDAEVELSGDLKMLEASPSWGARIGIHLASFEGSFLDVIDEDDAERVLTFLQSARSEGASSCLHASLRTFADDRVDARLYHAAQSGRSSACQHRLAVIFLGNTEPPVGTIVAKPPSEVSEDFSSDCERLFRPLVSAERSVGRPASDADEEMSDTLVCSESIADRSQVTRLTRSTLRPGSERNVCRTLTKGIQTDAQPTTRLADTSDAACQTAGIIRPPALPQTSQPSSRPQSRDRKVRPLRQMAFAGDVVPQRRLIMARTCQLMLLEDARKMNVRGSGCCAYHVIMSYIHKTVKSMTKSPCRQLEFHSDWQCAICHALHSFEEDQESDADDGKFWCDVCGCTEVPAEPDTAPSSMEAEAMSDGAASSFEDVETSSQFST